MADVTVLLAVYNGEEYVKEQLDSLLAQTFKDWFCLIHDDGSTDKSVKIIGEYVGRYPEKFSLLRFDPVGSAKKNFLSLLKYADSDYLMFCDQDDVWLPTKIEMTYKRFLETENGCIDLPAAVFSDLIVVDKNLSIIANSFMEYCKLSPENCFFARMLGFNVMAGCTMMFNRALAKKALECDPDKIYMHDWWCGLIASVKDRIGYLDEQTILYRQHGTNCVGATGRKTIISKIWYGLIKKQTRELTTESYGRKRIQANELLKYGALNETQRAIVQQFCDLDKLLLLRRFFFCRKTLSFGPYASLECAITAKSIHFN